MSDIKVCRICLGKGVKVFNYNSFHLKQYYEEIMARKVNEKDGLPNYFCYECAAILYKFHKFKEKCWMGEKALKELQWSGSITFTSISQIDRQDNKLQSPINIMRVSNRVRTQRVKHQTLSEKLVKEIEKDEIPEIEEYIVHSDSEDSLDDKNLAEVKNEMDIEETIIDSKTDIENEQSAEVKAIPELEDDRMFSDDGGDSNLENVNAIVKTVVKEEINVEEVKINFNSEQANSDEEIVVKENHNEKKRTQNRTKTDFSGKKAKRFEISTKNFLDPNHWLKINLTEEEALEEFRARAENQKYVSAAYKCSDCYKGFSKEDMLNRHIKLRHSESLGPITCRFCNMRFKVNCQLTRHITQHYTKYKCLRCDLICPLKTTADFHNDYHNGVIRNCIHCGDEFRHLSTYYTHLRTHRSEHVCTLCGASFVSVTGLGIHKKLKHVNADSNPEEGVTHTDTYCDRCDIKFETRKAYQEHVFHSAKHTEGVEASACEMPAPAKRKKGRRLIRRNPRKFTTCTLCNKTFSRLNAYMKHHTEEHKDQPLPLQEEQRHICEICGASLAANSVAAHLNTHTREKLYNCSICRMQFNSKGSMNRHQLTHTGEKPFECSLCEKRFTQNGSLKLHYRTFHLKEPYPKRNRRKNIVSQQEMEDE